jgi:hypothetical protein
MDRVEAIERYLGIPMRGGGPGKEELMDRFNTIRRRLEEKEGEVAARVAAAQAERNVAQAGEAAAIGRADTATLTAAAAEAARAAADADRVAAVAAAATAEGRAAAADAAAATAEGARVAAEADLADAEGRATAADAARAAETAAKTDAEAALAAAEAALAAAEADRAADRAAVGRALIVIDETAAKAREIDAATKAANEARAAAEAERAAAEGRAAAAEVARGEAAAALAAETAARGEAAAALAAETAAKTDAEGRATAAAASLAAERAAKAAETARREAAEAARAEAEAERNARPDATARAAQAAERDAALAAERDAAVAARAAAEGRAAAAEAARGEAATQAAQAAAALATEKARVEAVEKAHREAAERARAEAAAARAQAEGAVAAAAVAQAARDAAETDRNTKVEAARGQVEAARAEVTEARAQADAARGEAAAARAQADAAAAAVTAARSQAAEAQGQAAEARQGLATAAGSDEAQRAALAAAEAASSAANQRAASAEAASAAANQRAASAEARAAAAEARAAAAEQEKTRKAAENAQTLEGVRAQAQAATEASNAQKAANARTIAENTAKIEEFTRRAATADAELAKKNAALTQSREALEKANTDNATKIAEAEQRHAAALQEAQRRYGAELEAARTGKEGEAEEVERARAAELAGLRAEHEQALAALRQAQVQAIAALREEQEKAIATANTAHEQALERAAAATREAQSQFAALQETNRGLKAESKANTELHKRLLISIKSELERQRKDAEDGVEPEAISKDIQDIINLIKEHRGVVEELEKELSQNKTALEEAAKGCDELRKKYNGLIGKLTIADVLRIGAPPGFPQLLPGRDESPYGPIIYRILQTTVSALNSLNIAYIGIGDHDTFFDLTLENINIIDLRSSPWNQKSHTYITYYLKHIKDGSEFVESRPVGVGNRLILGPRANAASLPFPGSVPSPRGSPSAAAGAAALAATGPLGVPRVFASVAPIDFTKINTKEQLINLSMQQINDNTIRPYLNADAKIIYDKIKKQYPLDTGKRSELLAENVLFDGKNILNTPIKTLLNSSINTPPFTKTPPTQQKSLAFVESIKTAVLGPRIASGARNHGPGKEWFEGGGSLIQEAEKALFGGSLEEDPIETLLRDLPNQSGGADETDILLNLCTLNTLYTLVIMYLLSDDGDDKKSFYKIALLHELENPIKLSKSEKKLFLTSFSLVPSEDVEALIKKYSPRIPKDALIGAYSILSKFVNTSAIGDPLVKYFFLFLKVVASFLDEKSKVLEELGCPNPIMTLEDYPTLPITP